MAFTQPCFIRKNTPELRKKLEDLGYISHIFNNNDANNIYADKLGTYISVDIENQPYYIDCGTNEQLFLALAALRDDSDKWQLFIFDGIDVPDYFLQKGDMWICSLDKHLVENCHKATVEEIIEHFK